jgi:phage terminase large subunit-like protein
MYQQQPVPDEGELFAPDKLMLRDHTSDIFNRVRAWDLAGTVEGDWTCGVLIGKTKAGGFVVINVRRMRGTPDKVRAFILETAMGDTRLARISLPKDPGQAGLFQVEALTKALAGYTVVSSPETGDKQTRAEPYAVQVNTRLQEDGKAAGKWNTAEGGCFYAVAPQTLGGTGRSWPGRRRVMDVSNFLPFPLAKGAMRHPPAP